MEHWDLRVLLKLHKTTFHFFFLMSKLSLQMLFHSPICTLALFWQSQKPPKENINIFSSFCFHYSFPKLYTKPGIITVRWKVSQREEAANIQSVGFTHSSCVPRSISWLMANFKVRPPHCTTTKPPNAFHTLRSQPLAHFGWWPWRASPEWMSYLSWRCLCAWQRKTRLSFVQLFYGSPTDLLRPPNGDCSEFQGGKEEIQKEEIKMLLIWASSHFSSPARPWW